MNIRLINQEFSVCQVEDYSEVHMNIPYCFPQKTDEENSLVCPTTIVPANTTKSTDRLIAFRIEGVLDFSLIGILAKITTILASNNISIFAVSTYNTDYILIKKENRQKAIDALTRESYTIIESSRRR